MNLLANMKIREKLLIGFAMIVLFFAASSAYTIVQVSEINDTSRETAERNAPAWDAIMEAKVEVLMGHLWLEEAIAMQATDYKDKIFAHWSQATWLAQALLHGGEKGDMKLQRIDDTDARDAVTEFIKHLDTFVTLASQRFETIGQSDLAQRQVPDKDFNHQFELLIENLSSAEGAIAKVIQEAHEHSQELVEQEVQSILIELVIMVLISIIIAIYISQFVVARPLNEIIKMLDRVADGDLTAVTVIKSKDEIGMLSESIERMVEKLSKLLSRVQKSGIQVASSVTEIAASTKEQEATVTEHAATTNQIAASVNEISATSKQLGETTEDVTQLAIGTADSATDGQKILNNLDETMNRMAAASGSIADKLADLNEKASNIGNMVTTINKVADQTNLLSLNAAIEAEKAGEYGRGFAVVATEIRRLADQTAVATYDIEQMVAEVSSAISAGVMTMDKFSEEIHSSVSEAKNAGVQLEHIIEQAQSLAPHIESVNEGLQAQVEGASQISEAMMELSEAAQQTAEFVRQSNGAIADLNDAAKGMQEGVSVFKVKS